MDARRANILVVDDEADVLEQLEELLQGQYNVTVASSFDDAVSRFATQTPDVAVLDIMGVNGEELLARFHTRAPCLMLTAHALTPQHLKSAAKGGARLYLPKDELVHVPEYVQKLLDNPKQSLWGWLLGRLNFARWFGAANWSIEDENFLKDLTIEDIERDLKMHD